MQPRKECSLIICNSMNGKRGIYTNWNKPSTERQVKHYLAPMWSLKKEKGELMEVKNVMA